MTLISWWREWNSKWLLVLFRKRWNNTASDSYPTSVHFQSKFWKKWTLVIFKIFRLKDVAQFSASFKIRVDKLTEMLLNKNFPTLKTLFIEEEKDLQSRNFVANAKIIEYWIHCSFIHVFLCRPLCRVKLCS